MDLKVNESFTYAHYVNGLFSVYINFDYSDGYYISSCNEDKTVKYKSIATPVIKEAYKEDDVVRLRVKVAFITKDKIYGDYKLSKVISDIVDDDRLNYVNDADEYEYVFYENGHNYILNSVVKIIES